MEPEWDRVVQWAWEHPEDRETLVRCFAELARRFPHSARAQFEWANALDFCDAETQAIPHYEESLRLGLTEPERSYALIQLGSSLRVVGRPAEAAAVLTRANEESGMMAAALFLGLALVDAGRSEEAFRVVLSRVLTDVQTPDLARYRAVLTAYGEALDCRG